VADNEEKKGEAALLRRAMFYNIATYLHGVAIKLLSLGFGGGGGGGGIFVTEKEQDQLRSELEGIRAPLLIESI
jgi:hypothetical protein